MVVRSGLENLQCAGRDHRLQAMGGECARGHRQEPVHRTDQKPSVHGFMLGRSRLRGTRLALRPQKRELAAMPYYVTASDGTDIAYDCMGEGEPIVLIHGFGANRLITWANTNWYQTLNRAGHKLIAIDCRGHGESEKPHDPEDYDEGRMAMDVIAVLAALEIPEIVVVGYSMGAQLAIRLMHDAPGRVGRAVLGGLCDNYFH